MRRADQRCSQFRHGIWHGSVERCERLLTHLLRWLELNRRRDRDIVRAIDEEYRALRDVFGVQHLIRGTEAELLSRQLDRYDCRNLAIGCDHRASDAACALGVSNRAYVARVQLVEKYTAG